MRKLPSNPKETPTSQKTPPMSPVRAVRSKRTKTVYDPARKAKRPATSEEPQTQQQTPVIPEKTPTSQKTPPMSPVRAVRSKRTKTIYDPDARKSKPPAVSEEPHTQQQTPEDTPTPQEPHAVSKRGNSQPCPDDTRISKRRKTTIISTKTAKISAPLNCCECEKRDKAPMTKCTGNDCTSRIHLSCLQSTHPNFEKNNKKQSWKCADCESCSICNKGVHDNIPLVKCYICFTCYHSNCYAKSTTERTGTTMEDRFCCEACDKAAKQKQKTILSKTSRYPRKESVDPANILVPETGSNDDMDLNQIEEFFGFPPTPNEFVRIPLRPRPSVMCTMVQNSNEQSSPSGDCNANESIVPDVAEWSTKEVYDFFKEKFPRHAHVFEDEEIDGHVLCRLTRNDVVKMFKLKLGPAIKIFEYIDKLQKNGTMLLRDLS